MTYIVKMSRKCRKASLIEIENHRRLRRARKYKYRMLDHPNATFSSQSHQTQYKQTFRLRLHHPTNQQWHSSTSSPRSQARPTRSSNHTKVCATCNREHLSAGSMEAMQSHAALVAHLTLTKSALDDTHPSTAMSSCDHPCKELIPASTSTKWQL